MFGNLIQRARLAACVKPVLFALGLVGWATGQAMGGDLDRFNPATTDPDLFRIAVSHSDRLKVPDKGARVRVVLKDRKTGKVLKRKEITLSQTSADRNDLAKLTGRTDTLMSVYRIPERQISEIRALQAKFLALPKDEREAIAGALSIDVSGCKVDPDDAGQMVISTMLKSSEFPDYVVLAEDYDLRNVPSKNGSGGADPIKPCR